MCPISPAQIFFTEDTMTIILELAVLAYIVYAICDSILKHTGWTNAAERKEAIKAVTIAAVLKK